MAASVRRRSCGSMCPWYVRCQKRERQRKPSSITAKRAMISALLFCGTYLVWGNRAIHFVVLLGNDSRAADLVSA
eukprot:6060701-Prymnesium_polylepis.1